MFRSNLPLVVFPNSHVLLRFNGHFGDVASQTDKWSCGIRLGHQAGVDPVYDEAKMQQLVNAAKTAAEAFHGLTNVATGTQTFLDSVSGAQIGVLGKYMPTDQQTIWSNLTPKAGVGTPNFPWNVAQVISLRTAVPRGRGSNGRVYWPITAGSVVSTTGRLAGLNTGARVNGFKVFLDALNTAGNAYSTGMKVIVASNVGGGSYNYVTHIRADDRADSIERRENDQPVVWTTATLA